MTLPSPFQQNLDDQRLERLMWLQGKTADCLPKHLWEGICVPTLNLSLVTNWFASLEDPARLLQLSRLLGGVQIFANQNKDCRMAAASALFPVRYYASDIVFTRGDAGDWMGIVLEGRFDYQVHPKSCLRQGLKGPGFSVGEISLLGIAKTRELTVKATVTSTLLVLTRKAFEAALMAGGRQHPLQILEDAARLGGFADDNDFTDILSTSKFFHRLGPSCLAMLSHNFEPRVYLAGQVIIHERHAGHEMHIIKEGLCTVTCSGKVLASLSSGSIFGELAILSSDCRRTATITCTELSLIYVLHADVFKQIMNSSKEMQRVFDQLYIARLTTYALQHACDEMREKDRCIGRAHPLKMTDVMGLVFGEDMPTGRFCSEWTQNRTRALPFLPPPTSAGKRTYR
eukprot:NODE_7467_length_1575_cov_7.811464.p1 GENE.NODE_7467_length_1575_cov_7.811464~~NODE_7467_length_1575_cov_7.811464.p1  ORF type:complete len:400 (-),score=93.34 NODE_7467_length_1575_cov_7.811464:286-1485(-)